MIGLYPGAVYPALYAYLVEVPVVPVQPPSLCLVSGARVRDLVTAEVRSESRVTSDPVRVVCPASPSTETTILVTCDIGVYGVITYESLVCRGFVTSEVQVRTVEASQLMAFLPVVASVVVRDRVCALECATAQVVAEVQVRDKVVAGVKYRRTGVHP